MNRSDRDDDLGRYYEQFGRQHEVLRNALVTNLLPKSTRGKKGAAMPWVGSVLSLAASKRLRLVRISGGVAAVVGLVCLLLVVSSTSSKPAFGEVLRQVRAARSVQFTNTVEFEQPQNIKKMTLQVIMLAPHLMRIEMPDQDAVNIVNMETGQFVLLMHTQKIFEEQNEDFSDEVPADPMMRPQGFNIVEQFANLTEEQGQFIGTELIDDREYLVYHAEQIEGAQGTMMIWVDPETKLPVRVDADMEKPIKATSVATDIVWDVEVDESLFSMEAPEGYRSMREAAEQPIDRSEQLAPQVDAQDSLALLKQMAPDVDVQAIMDEAITEKDLIEALRRLAELYNDTFPQTFHLLDRKWVYRLGSVTKDMEADIPMILKISRGLTFAYTQRKNDWHYAGAGVSLGQADTPIAWWRPDESSTYRVIYGDLSIRDVEPDDLLE